MSTMISRTLYVIDFNYKVDNGSLHFAKIFSYKVLIDNVLGFEIFFAFYSNGFLRI